MMFRAQKLKSFKYAHAALAFIIVMLYIYISKHLPVSNLTSSQLTTAEAEDIFKAKVQPEKGKNIFFIESGDSTHNVSLSARQACAIESAAMTNPNLKVFVIFTSEERLKLLERKNVIDAILSYPNVIFNFVNLENFSVGTPANDFMKSKKLESSKFKVEHTSDVTRLLLLWRYGGTYLDSDMIVRRNLDTIPSNFACPETEVYLNGAVLNFGIDELSHDLADLFLENLVANFDGDSWGHNGPLLVSQILYELCNTTSTLEMTQKGNCQGFHVLSQESCYAYNGYNWDHLMEEKFSDEAMKMIQDSLVVHFWNHDTKNIKLLKNSTAAYIQLAKQFCPKVMETVEDYF